MKMAAWATWPGIAAVCDNGDSDKQEEPNVAQEASLTDMELLLKALEEVEQAVARLEMYQSHERETVWHPQMQATRPITRQTPRLQPVRLL